MQKLYKPARVGMILAVMAALLTLYVSALYKLQIYDARPEDDELYPQRTITHNVTLAAARGDIYDRNGILLASGRPSYRILLARSERLPNSERNNVIRQLVYSAIENGIRYTDTFPITQGAPFTYFANMTTAQRRNLDSYFDYFGISNDITASELLSWLRDHYGIDYTTGIAEARLIIGIRYELEIRVIVRNLAPYIFAEDADVDYVSRVVEMGLPGVYTESKWVREYHTSFAAQLMGFTGSMNSDEIEKYSELGYPMDAIIGKAGIEQAFEEYLHGVDGLQTITQSDTGAILSVNTEREPSPGGNLYTSLDIRLQEAVEGILARYIEQENEQRSDEDRITGGAVVVEAVQTGELLASASYPSFDLKTIAQNLVALNNDATMPMLNRATQGKYNPGSTFKMITAYAVLRTGVVSRWTEIDDTGKFMKYDSPQPVCWIYPSTGHGHGPLNIVEALRDSCNYYFYQSADSIGYSAEDGANALAEAAMAFGLGQKTGLEVLEISGTLATPEFKKERFKDTNDAGWWRGDTLFTAIGQGHNQFTPIQMANYVATIANGGTRYALTLLSKVKSADFSELIYEHVPEPVNEIAEKEFIGILQEGMKAVAKSGTAASVFRDYQPAVAAKTGTVQLGGSTIDNGLFVCYAPADNPEISISVVIEKGGSGSAIMGIAKDVLDYYFIQDEPLYTVPAGSLIP